ncbi:hypothetical protein D3C71_1011170 [compost metagenome]
MVFGKCELGFAYRPLRGPLGAEQLSYKLNCGEGGWLARERAASCSEPLAVPQDPLHFPGILTGR